MRQRRNVAGLRRLRSDWRASRAFPTSAGALHLSLPGKTEASAAYSGPLLLNLTGVNG